MSQLSRLRRCLKRPVVLECSLGAERLSLASGLFLCDSWRWSEVGWCWLCDCGRGEGWGCVMVASVEPRLCFSGDNGDGDRVGEIEYMVIDTSFAVANMGTTSHRLLRQYMTDCLRM